MTRTISFLNKILNPVCNAFSQIGGVIVIIMMFFIFCAVLSRYLFSKPVTGDVEYTQFLMVLVASLAISYTALNKGHIRVDLILTYVPKRVTRILDIFCYSASIIFYILICWQNFVGGFGLYANQRTPLVLPIPIYPFAFFLAVGCILLVLVFLRDVLESIRGEAKK